MTYRIWRPARFVTEYIVCLGAVVFVGCEKKHPDLYPVTGTVHFDGQLVSEGTVTFYPQDGSRPAMGPITEDGSYVLKTFDDGPGAKVGQHKVTVEAFRETVNEIPPGQPGVEPAFEQKVGRTSVEWFVPMEYSRRNSSGLTAEVKEGENQINFDLPEK